MSFKKKFNFKTIILFVSFFIVCLLVFLYLNVIMSLFYTNLSVLSALKGNSFNADHYLLLAKKNGFFNSGQYYHQYILDHNPSDLKKAFLKNPKNVNYILLYADETILKGDWLSSNQYFNNIPFARYLARRGMEIAYNQDAQLAKKGLYYLCFSRKILKDAQISNFLGSVLCNRYKSYQKGEPLLFDAIKENPKNPNFYNNLASVKSNERKIVLYRSFTETSRRLDDSNVQTYLSIGNSLIQENNPKEGIYFFLKAKNMDPKSSNIRYSLARAYEKLGNYSLAESEYLSAVGLNPYDYNPRYEWGVFLYQHKEYSRSIIQFSLAISLKSDHVLSFYYRGLCYMEKKNYSKAKDDFAKSLELDPNNQSIKNQLQYLEQKIAESKNRKP